MNIEYEPVTEMVYKPHCGNCGCLIDDNDISYRDIYREPTETMLAEKLYTRVYPYRCPNCGALFNCIKIPMPKKLPDESIGLKRCTPKSMD